MLSYLSWDSSTTINPNGRVELYVKRPLLMTLRSDRQDVYMSQDETYEHRIPPFHVAFSEKRMHGTLLAVADEEGWVSLFTTHDRKPHLPQHHQSCNHERPMSKFSAHQNAIFDLIWCSDDAHIATASGDQHLSVWDVETSAKLCHFEGHSMSVKCVRQMPGSPHVFASGSRDGNVYFWDTRHPYPVSSDPNGVATFRPVDSCIRCHDFDSSATDRRKKRRMSIPNAQRSVTCVEFTGDGNQLISSGAVDGYSVCHALLETLLTRWVYLRSMVKFWDLRAMEKDAFKLVRSFSCLNPNGRRYGISSLTLDHTKTKLLVSAASNDIFLYDLVRATNDPVAKYYGHKNSSFYVKSGFSPDSNFVVSGSVDHNVYIWDAQSAGAPAVVLRGHEGEVSSVAWCKADFSKIASCSDDGTVRVWHMGHDMDEISMLQNTTSSCGRGCHVGRAEVYPESPMLSSTIHGLVVAHAPPASVTISPAAAATTSRPSAAAAQPTTLHHFWK
ncbi:hypothetical protein DYB32_008547 [Aphanomyces invadans]|uniref:Uncharacterized protein n=1 Tax=Aphanomyces invadans TaxID=157072 RepID=A0A3R7CVC3_9STRA|nr:hypothetical protein DYB32_008547 [Aphanomyces invadans]